MTRNNSVVHLSNLSSDTVTIGVDGGLAPTSFINPSAMSLFAPGGPRRLVGFAAALARVATVVSAALTALFPHDGA